MRNIELLRRLYIGSLLDITNAVCCDLVVGDLRWMIHASVQYSFADDGVISYWPVNAWEKACGIVFGK